MRHTWKALLTLALIVASTGVALPPGARKLAAPAAPSTPLASGPVLEPDEPDDPVFPPTFCAEGASCAGCNAACRQAFEYCMNSQPYCHMDGTQPMDPRCGKVCETGENKCLGQAATNCR